MPPIHKFMVKQEDLIYFDSYGFPLDIRWPFTKDGNPSAPYLAWVHNVIRPELQRMGGTT